MRRTIGTTRHILGVISITFSMLVVLSTTGNAQTTIPFLGYFNADPITVMVDNWVRVPDQQIEVSVFDENGDPTGETKWVWTFKRENQPYPVTEICGERVLNSVRVGSHGGKAVMAVLIHNPAYQSVADALVAHADYLGHPQDIIDLAETGDATALAITDEILYVQYETVAGGSIRNTVKQWKLAGSPEPMSEMQLYNEWYVASQVMVEDEPLNQILGPNLLLNQNLETWTGIYQDEISDNFIDWGETGVNDSQGDKVVLARKAIKGTWAARIIRTVGEDVGIRQTVEPVAEGEQYKIAVWCAGDGTAQPRIRIMTRAGAWTVLHNGLGSTDDNYKKFIKRVTIPAGATKLRLWLTANEAGAVWFDRSYIRKILQ